MKHGAVSIIEEVLNRSTVIALTVCRKEDIGNLETVRDVKAQRQLARFLCSQRNYLAITAHEDRSPLHTVGSPYAEADKDAPESLCTKVCQGYSKQSCSDFSTA